MWRGSPSNASVLFQGGWISSNVTAFSFQGGWIPGAAMRHRMRVVQWGDGSPFNVAVIFNREGGLRPMWRSFSFLGGWISSNATVFSFSGGWIPGAAMRHRMRDILQWGDGSPFNVAVIFWPGGWFRPMWRGLPSNVSVFFQGGWISSNAAMGHRSVWR